MKHGQHLQPGAFDTLLRARRPSIPYATAHIGWAKRTAARDNHMAWDFEGTRVYCPVLCGAIHFPNRPGVMLCLETGEIYSDSRFTEDAPHEN